MQQTIQYLQPEIVSQISTMELRAKLVVEGFITGMHKSPYHGFSVEFAEHRQYMVGDEIRRIDWKVYGKTNRYYIKQYEEETNLKSYIILDTSASMSFSSEISKGKKRISKLQYASYLAAALSYLMIQQRDAVGLTLYDEKIRTTIPPHATKLHLRKILSELENAMPSNNTSIGKNLHIIAEQIHRRGLVIIMSDFFDDVETITSALQHFRHNNNEVLVMQILDPLERTFAFGSDAVFKDMETGETITTQPYHLQKEYQKAMQQFVERYKLRCREMKIDYLLLDTSTSYDVALLNYLMKRKKMR